MKNYFGDGATVFAESFLLVIMQSLLRWLCFNELLIKQDNATDFKSNIQLEM